MTPTNEPKIDGGKKLFSSPTSKTNKITWNTSTILEGRQIVSFPGGSYETAVSCLKTLLREKGENEILTENGGFDHEKKWLNKESPTKVL